MARDFEKQRELEHQRHWLMGLVAQAQSSFWHGTLTIKIVGGELVQCTSAESKVPPPFVPGINKPKEKTSV